MEFEVFKIGSYPSPNIRIGTVKARSAKEAVETAIGTVEDEKRGAFGRTMFFVNNIPYVASKRKPMVGV